MKDLDEHSRDWTWVVLFFDVYERTGPALDRWLRDLVWGERYGELPLKVLVVMSGQGRLTPAVWGEMSPFMEEVVLDSFTEEEARDPLARKGVADEDIVTTVLHLSGRLPVLVDMLASHQPADPGTDGCIARRGGWKPRSQTSLVRVSSSPMSQRMGNWRAVICIEIEGREDQEDGGGGA
ncbi:hypothetical protein [Streptomyces carpaticus]|uniref:hypothetical protein n=1 Tax=Streptomyces carpaticus TaxID=285558 RepID=UPI0031F8731E